MEFPTLVGKSIAKLAPADPPGPCAFAFSDGSHILVECDWRIVHSGRVALAAKDHRQLFGRQEPLDVGREGAALLAGKAVTRASLRDTGDLVVEFEGDIRLETFTDSCGYESCTIDLVDGSKVVVTGGGAIVAF